MCGIAGLTRFDGPAVEPDLLRRLSRTLRHRGPDDLGFLTWSGNAPARAARDPDELAPGRVGLVHNRLSILDLTDAGWQPMATPDGRFHIVFNGEIYNYLELRTELEALGHPFGSHSDTEVLLAAYAQWGSRALNRLVGMFAFAVLDTAEHKLFLARDFFGIKPLYYTFWADQFAFASEIKALLELPGLPRQMNAQPLYNYLRFGLTDDGDQTLLEGIHHLPAAHYLEISLDKPRRPRPKRYWKPTIDKRLDISEDEASQRLREMFCQNIRLHLRSDVPVGAALSGGIDSSAIVMTMRHVQGNGFPLHTFSYVAEDPALSEERWVDIVAEAGHTVVHKAQPTPEELVADLDHMISVQDEPFSSTSMYAQHHVFRMAHKAGIKVMLDGQGADEILGGYRYFIGAQLTSLLRRGRWVQAARLLRRALRLPGLSGLTLLFYTGEFLVPPALQGLARRLVSEDLSPAWMNADWFHKRGVILQSPRRCRTRDALREQLHQTLVETSLPKLLRYEDRNSMAHSIESRVPFLTPEMVDFVLSLPPEYIISPHCTTKAAFRLAMRGIVPDAILDRTDKIGLATPEQAWLSHLRPWVQAVLESAAAADIPALNPQRAQREWQAVLNGRKRFDARVWRWINLIRWVDQVGVSFGA